MTLSKPRRRIDFPRVVILAAGSPHFGNLATPTRSALSGQTVLDLAVGGLSNLGLVDICVVTGDKSSSFEIKRFENVEFLHNAAWSETGRVGSILLGAQSSENGLLVLYGDTLFREDAIQRVLDAPGDLVIGIDETKYKSAREKANPKNWGYETVCLGGDRPIFDLATVPRKDCPELAGIFLFRESALKSLKSDSQNLSLSMEEERENFLNLLQQISDLSKEIEFVSVSGLREEIRSPVDIPAFFLGSKARALRLLRPLLKKSVIQDQIVTTRKVWREDSQQVCELIAEKFGLETPLIVRSSASGEDGFLSSQAGVNLSRLNITGLMSTRLAIEEVFASYANEFGDDEVLIQPMVNRVLFSGVCLTRTLNNHDPWYVVTYTTDGLTDSVTSGRGEQIVTRMVARDSITHDSLPDEIRDLLSAVSEIEQVVHFSALDIEFAVDEDFRIHIFQVRPLIGFQQTASKGASDSESARNQARLDWNERRKYEPFGSQIEPFMSNMADWNPAEMIGENPETLARTMYETLITDETWAVQRFEVGFHDFRGLPLMYSIFGRPYIDTRLSLGSFVPRSVGKKTAANVLRFSIDTLRENPHLHDKVEFDVAPTCMDLDWPRWRETYSKVVGLSERELGEFEKGLFAVTKKTISTAPLALQRINSLDIELEKLLADTDSASIAQTVSLVRALGALPFAHLARAGFVAVSMLRSGVSSGYLSDVAVSDFYSSLQTISAQLLDEAYLVSAGKKRFDDFVRTFGHLRPGTYDLKSPRYDSVPNLFLQPLVERASPRSPDLGQVWNDEKANFLQQLVGKGLFLTIESAETALRQGITGREQGKFLYSKGVSQILSQIETLGRKLGIEAELLSELSIHQVLAIESEENLGPIPRPLSVRPPGELAYPVGFSSPTVSSPDDFHHYIELTDQPNFIGSSAVLGPMVFLTGNELDTDLFGASPVVALIERADPGFDWIFGKQIAGLITQYGGANSHMAIRTAEFCIPAAIGVGRRKFEELRRANLVEINPLSKVVRKVT